MHRPAVSFAWPLMVAVALAGVCGLGGPSRRLAPVVGVCGFFLLMTRHLYGQSWIWQQSYDRLFLTVPVVAIVAALLTPFRHHRGLIVALALVAATTWMRIGLPVVSFRTTDHLEYTWLRDRLRLLPRECRVVHLAAAGDRGVEIPTFLRATSSPAIALDPRRPREYEMAFSPAPCIYYVHTSLCSSLEARAKCEGIEDRVELEIVAREAFPARPSSPIIPYDRDPVETWIGRVVRGGGGIRPES